MSRNPGRSGGITAHVGWDQYRETCTQPSRLPHLEAKQTIPSVTQHVWEGTEPCLRAVMEGLQQRASEGQHLPRSMGLLASGKAARARARRLKSPAYPHQELALLIEGQETLGEQQEPPLLEHGEVSGQLP